MGARFEQPPQSHSDPYNHSGFVVQSQQTYSETSPADITTSHPQKKTHGDSHQVAYAHAGDTTNHGEGHCQDENHRKHLIQLRDSRQHCRCYSYDHECPGASRSVASGGCKGLGLCTCVVEVQGNTECYNTKDCTEVGTGHL